MTSVGGASFDLDAGMLFGVTSCSKGMLALAFLAMAVAACSSFSVTDAPQDDGSADASTVDASDASGPPFCSTHSNATLCWDFDLAARVENGWTGTEIMGGGGAFASNAQSVSGAQSFHSIVARAPELSSRGRLFHDVAIDKPRVRLSFDIKIRTPPIIGTGELSVAELLCTNRGTNDGAWLYYHASTAGPVFGVETEKGASFTRIPAPTDSWTHYEVDAQWSRQLIIIRVDGGAPTKIRAPSSCAMATNARVNIGLATINGTYDVNAFFDNVLYEELPEE